MQLRIVYSSFTHWEIIDSGTGYNTADVDDLALPTHAEVQPLHTPATVITEVSGTDAQLAAILSVLGDPWTSILNPYPEFVGTYPGLINTGLMPDGNQFIEIDVTELIDRTFDEWQWYVDNDPTSVNLPVGFSAGWMARRGDVHDFKVNPANTSLRIKTGKHNLYSNAADALISFDGEGRMVYSYGLPSIVEAWIYDYSTNALLATDANMSVTVMENPLPGIRPTEFEIYEFILGGGTAQKFWTNFKACVEDV